MAEFPDTDPVRQLIAGLLLEAGRLMEDASAGLALALPETPAAVAARADRLHATASELLALARAAQVLAGTDRTGVGRS